MELEKLINSCIKKEHQAQNALYKLYKDVLFGVSLKYCINREEAQDNLQDSFIEILNNIKKFNNKGSFEGWMKRITINKAIDKYKKNIKSNTPLKDIHLKANIEIPPIKEIPLSIILKFIQELPDQYRICFNLYELDNYSHKEISTMLSISEGTSKSNLFRAKKVLKNKVLNYKKTNNSHE
ncbi:MULTISPECIES: RNA polymerase sigma factor [Tenacibaculum]|uniref:RNA polymerase sigma factor n=1 Tax=Tenacibaculum TaxID=104267 RepID=UPI000895A542|nr:sigma-70 family RNA polymerase sigma factor [Tenacibaculum sp. MAR_2010_89]SEE24372.1 RNA polymerase sigma-70 factor, ECF subfamily [Tenacibaculum sp. MAR_2010_89]